MTAGSETNCNSCTLGAILCDPDVHSACADLVDRPRWMHREEDWCLVHVDDVPPIAVRLIDGGARNVDDEIFSGR